MPWLLPAIAWATMPLETVPAWQSTPNGHVATGGAWADIDGDGWLDMVVANGNDMARQTVVIYHNNGDGTLPLNPTWSASDIDYHGHLDIGDVNGDGLPDVVVAVYIGPAGFGSPGRVKAYFNNGAGAFSSTPDWVSGGNFYTFSLALGDADGDGDLDLACAAGDDYFDHAERQRIFYNVGGTFESLPSWQSGDVSYALDAFWDDVEKDGDMDVVFCGSSAPVRIYRNDQTTGGGITTTPVWQNTDLPEYGNTAAFGDWNEDGYPEVAVADNDQLGGPGRFKVYANAAGTIGTTPAWTSATGGYGSHVSWIDLDLDGDSDLAAGRWWGQAWVYANTGFGLTSTPDWASATSSVIENMFWGDVDNDGLRSDGSTVATGDGLRTFFPIGQAPVHAVDEVRVDGAATTDFVSHLGYGWLSFATPPPDGAMVEIDYTYSVDVDLGVTNWDDDVGNYLFRNTGAIVGVPDVASALADLRALPNPMAMRTQIRYRGGSAGSGELVVVDVSGRLVRMLHSGPIHGGLRIWEWDGRDDSGVRVSSGVYYARMSAGADRRSLRLVVLE
jgi:hypothetical protein